MSATKPTKRPKHHPALFVLAVVGGLFGLFLVLVVLYTGWQLVQPYGADRAGKQLITVREGESTTQISHELANQKLISNPWLMQIMLNLGPAQGHVKSGPYLIQPGTSLYQIATILNRGEIAVVKLTFPEGLTIKQLSARWAAADLGSADDFVQATKQSYDFDFLSGTVPQGNLEGYLFPATYVVRRDSSAQSLVQQMLEAFGQQAWPILDAAPRPMNLSPNQTLTLASIVEKEANTSQDRKLVAGVFYNRLKAGMKLESDVTVNYATGKTTTSAADTRVDSVYNTYLAKALPPAPIDNPSLDAIEAALHPTDSDYLFFIADQKGTVHFAKTIEEHNDNIKKYL